MLVTNSFLGAIYSILLSVLAAEKFGLNTPIVLELDDGTELDDETYDLFHGRTLVIQNQSFESCLSSTASTSLLSASLTAEASYTSQASEDGTSYTEHASETSTSSQMYDLVHPFILPLGRVHCPFRCRN